MKKVKSLLTILSICALATPLLAVKVEIMPTVGKAFNTDKDSLQDDEILYGVRGSIYLNEDVAVQAALEASEDNVKSNQGKTDIERGSINIVYEPNGDRRIRPFTVIGVGGEKVHGANVPGDNDDSQAFVNAGAGLKFGLNKHIDLVAEAKWLKKLENQDSDYIATVGVGVKVGESKKRVEHTQYEPKIPSVTETTDVENAISLAKFKEIYEKKPAKTVSQEIATVEPVTVVEESTPEAIVVEESNFIEEIPAQTDQTQDGYYVQMAALFKSDGKVLTDRLEKKDYSYVLHNVDRGGKEATLVLVGPYESRAEAGVAIKFLKRLKRDAFVYHMN